MAVGFGGGGGAVFFSAGLGRPAAAAAAAPLLSESTPSRPALERGPWARGQDGVRAQWEGSPPAQIVIRNLRSHRIPTILGPRSSGPI